MVSRQTSPPVLETSNSLSLMGISDSSVTGMRSTHFGMPMISSDVEGEQD